MKSLFYGGAIAAVSGLLLGAGMKAPLAVEDAGPMTEVYADFQTAELDADAVAPQYVAPSYYVPVVEVVRPAAEAEPAVELTPAAYTPETEYPAPDPAPIYELAAVEPEPAPMNLIRSAGAVPEPPVAEHRQGFALVGEAPDPS